MTEPSTLPLYRAVIDHVATTGEAPTDAALAARTGLHLEQIVPMRTELVEKDWLGQDAAGNLVALYPFRLSRRGLPSRSTASPAMRCVPSTRWAWRPC
jgi:hypothetical protein